MNNPRSEISCRINGVACSSAKRQAYGPYQKCDRHSPKGTKSNGSFRIRNFSGCKIENNEYQDKRSDDFT